MYYAPKWGKELMTDVLRSLPSNKALGADGISDQWLRKKKNAEGLMRYIGDIINKGYKVPELANNARMHFLSKTEDDEPPINRVRPIAIYTPIRKVIEIMVDRLDKEFLWASVHKAQFGARPGGTILKPTYETLKTMYSGEYEYAWFIDFTEAFNMIHQPILLDELKRRYEIWNEVEYIVGQHIELDKWDNENLQWLLSLNKK